MFAAAALTAPARAAELNLSTATIADLQAAMQAGALTSEKLVGLYLARIDAYEAKAIHLATHPDALAHARQALVIGKASGTLYDTEHFTQNLEQAFSKMLDL
jgi:predicted O-linked N-acetylglucosamine transferase (SPINDLY family)